MNKTKLRSERQQKAWGTLERNLHICVLVCNGMVKQADLARECKVSRSCICQIVKRGKKPPSLIKRMFKTLGNALQGFVAHDSRRG